MKRIQKLQKQVKKLKLSAILISKPENVRYLCGFTGTNGKLFITPKKATLITDFRYFVTARKLGLDYYDRKDGYGKLISKYKTVGFEAHHITVSRLKYLKKAVSGVKFKPAPYLVEEMRMIKDSSEIKIMKKAIKMADECFKKFVKTIKVGQSEDDMEWNLHTIARKLGAEDFSFPPIICFGKNTADVHHQKEANRLKKGEKILIDFGIKYKEYCTDMTRVLYLDKRDMTKAEQKIYSIVLRANQEAISAIKVGKKLSEIDRA
ncbi:Xaa-Pro peptidase family protein, partial [Patescibacteria group bacterium]|nr:Xaa-Pro peptidase family protein [Patescibacteria group bacterium]